MFYIVLYTRTLLRCTDPWTLDLLTPNRQTKSANVQLSDKINCVTCVSSGNYILEYLRKMFVIDCTFVNFVS